MSKEIFPIEIAGNTTEYNFVRNNRKFNHVYNGIIIFLIACFTSLPFVNIDVTTQSRGIIRTLEENTQIQSVTHGLVKHSNIIEGLKVQRGDTLMLLDSDKIKEQIYLVAEQYDKNIK